MRRSYILGLCLSTCLTSPAAAESWYHIATSDESIDYADADSVRTYGKIISVDVFRGFESDGFVKVAVDLSCAENRFRLTRIVSYDSSRRYLETADDGSGWNAIGAGSIIDQVRHFACDGSLRDSRISDPFADAEDYWYYYYEN